MAKFDQRDKERFWRKKGLTTGKNKAKSSQYERKTKWGNDRNY